MAGKRRRKVKESEVTATKYLWKLLPLLERLHDDGCAPDKAGNRRLHVDHSSTLILLYLFNPVVVSLRSLQQASELQKVQKLLGCKRASLGSLSEAITVFDPDRLKEIIAELGQEHVSLGRDPRLQDVPGLLTVVDGTLLSAFPKMMETSLRKRKTGTGMVKWRRRAAMSAVSGTTAGSMALSPVNSRNTIWQLACSGIATNLLDVPAETVAVLYKHRWTIEIFFWFFKHVPGCRHLLSHDERGIEIQTYCATIACMLIILWTGRKPSLRVCELIYYYFSGLASEEELLAHVAKLPPQPPDS